jgi:hypothetical protein
MMSCNNQQLLWPLLLPLPLPPSLLLLPQKEGEPMRFLHAGCPSWTELVISIISCFQGSVGVSAMKPWGSVTTSRGSITFQCEGLASLQSLLMWRLPLPLLLMYYFVGLWELFVVLLVLLLVPLAAAGCCVASMS